MSFFQNKANIKIKCEEDYVFIFPNVVIALNLWTIFDVASVTGNLISFRRRLFYKKHQQY